MSLRFTSPLFVDLATELARFVAEQNQAFYDDCDDALIERSQKDDGLLDVESLISDYDKLAREEIRDSSDVVGPSDDEIFAQSFHTLVHSASLPSILRKEKELADVVADLCRRMSDDVETLNVAQQMEMDQHIEMLDRLTTMEDINVLLGQHHANRDMIQGQWQAELEAKRGCQRGEYRNWIQNQVMANFLNQPAGEATPHTAIGGRSSIFSVLENERAESFTIHLGSQLKHMHNIRILSADVGDLCSPLHQSEK